MLIVTPLPATRICLGDGARRTKELQTFEEQLHRVLSPPRGGIPLCSSSRSQKFTVGDFLFSVPLCFISHVPTKTDAACGQGNLSCIPSAFGNMVHLTLWAFIAGLIEFWSLVYFTAHQADQFQIQIRTIHSFPSIHFTWL